VAVLSSSIPIIAFLLARKAEVRRGRAQTNKQTSKERPRRPLGNGKQTAEPPDPSDPCGDTPVCLRAQCRLPKLLQRRHSFGPTG
jgi:hypothetical protein